MAAITETNRFLSDVKELRARAREHMERGAVTQANGLDPKISADILNQALATELVCVLRYRRHYFTASGLQKEAIAAEFLTHSNEEQEHADALAERINQLGGKPNFNPDGLAARSHSEYNEPDDLVEMIRENLVAERIAIASYTEMIRYFGDKDPTTRRVLESILEVEEEHATDMVELLEAQS